MTDGGVPATSDPVAADSTAAAVSTRLTRMAAFGQDCTQAGASPASRRPFHRSHLRTIPRAVL